MNERGTQLQETFNAQIDELIDLVSTASEAALGLPCPGRERLGDSTVAACAMHTADNYHRIAGFLQGQRGAGHTRLAKLPHRHGEDKHQDNYRADNIGRRAQLDRLFAARECPQRARRPVRSAARHGHGSSRPLRFASKLARDGGLTSTDLCASRRC